MKGRICAVISALKRGSAVGAISSCRSFEQSARLPRHRKATCGPGILRQGGGEVECLGSGRKVEVCCADMVEDESSVSTHYARIDDTK